MDSADAQSHHKNDMLFRRFYVLGSIINSIANKSKLSLQNCDSGMTDRGEYFDNWMVFKKGEKHSYWKLRNPLYKNNICKYRTMILQIKYILIGLGKATGKRKELLQYQCLNSKNLRVNNLCSLLK